MTKNWSNIHPDFGKNRLWSEYFQYQWKNNGFDYQQVQAWINADVRPWEHSMVWWLANIKKQDPQQLNRDDVEKLRKEYFACEETIAWLQKGFTEAEINQWISQGLKSNEHNLANYLKTNNLTFSEELRNEYYQAQNWLDFNYPQEARSQVKELSLVNLNLQGSLQLENFPNLEGVYCAGNKLTNLTLANCPQLKTVLCNRNNLTNLKLVNCPNISKLVANKNQLTSLDFLLDLSHENLEMLNVSGNNISQSDLTLFQNFTNLRHLGLGNWYKETINQDIYNRFYGSLEPLQNMNYLEELDLAGTDVDSGWEYLSESLQTLYLVSKERPNSQVQIIAEQLRQYGETAKDRHEDDNFATLLTKYKTTKKIQELEEEKEQFKEKQKEISYLELRVQELTNLINTQKEKIINSFLRLFPEKDLLQELITKHLELTKFKKQGINSEDYDENIEEYEEKILAIKKQLRKKLSKEIVKETMNNIQGILTDCEELVHDELELETKLQQKQSLISSHKKNAQQITGLEANRIVELEKKTQEQQMIQFGKEKSHSVTEIIAKLEGERNAYKEVALTSCTPIINNNNSNVNTNDSYNTSNSRAYHDSSHSEFNSSQLYQGEVATLTTRTKRNLSISSTTELAREETKLAKLDEEQLQAYQELSPKK